MTRAVVALTLLLAALPSLARAQEDEARADFERGTAAIHEGRFSEARDALTRSLALVARPATAFNLAIALRGMGSYVLASATCHGLLDGQWGELDAPRRAEASELCGEVDVAIAHLIVRLAGDVGAELRLDGAVLGSLRPGASLERLIDPGPHLLTLRAPEALSPPRPPLDRRIEVAAGARLDLELSVPRASAVPPRASDDTWLIAGVTIGVGVAVALVVTLVALAATGAFANSDSLGPADFPVVAALRTQ